MTQNRSILGISIAVVLVLLVVSGLVLFRESKSQQARVDQRFPLQRLAYCTSDPVTPCVVSFGLDGDGDMLVSLLTDGAFYPDFYLKIRTEASEHTYVCQKVDRFATSVYCSGKALPVGQVFQFMIFSLNEDILLAQGNFPIIGMALVTPEVFSSPTPTITPTGRFPTPEGTLTPSYPSYPGSEP